MTRIYHKYNRRLIRVVTGPGIMICQATSRGETQKERDRQPAAQQLKPAAAAGPNRRRPVIRRQVQVAAAAGTRRRGTGCPSLAPASAEAEGRSDMLHILITSDMLHVLMP